jgi:S-DNA-T family DNA segregation ATPase FtsK/SpoIIIE
VIVAAPAHSPLARTEGVTLITPAGADFRPDPAIRSRLLLVDDSEAFLDTPGGALLERLMPVQPARTAVVVAGRPDELSLTYRGIAHDVRRARCAILLQPSPGDGEVIGLRLPHTRATLPVGRGLLIGDPAWGPEFGHGPIPIQVARP